MKRDGLIQMWVEKDQNAEVYGPLIAQGINSPLFQQADFMATEFMYGFGSIGALGALGKTFRAAAKAPGALMDGIPIIPGNVVKFAQPYMEALKYNTSKLNMWIGNTLEDNKHYWDMMQQGMSDAYELSLIHI